jgi:peptidoglycan/xylan/chitin deacetylase (PgdA/CDA1 family)
MDDPQIWARIQGRYQRGLASGLFRRPLEMNNTRPLISFTFDDFPRSALRTGGAILKRFGMRGTYYASFGLMGQDAPTGRIFEAEDLAELVAQGHELGCHTFHHCHSWDTSPARFEESIAENQRALERLLPGRAFQSFSYPISCPRPGSKRRTGRRFACSRGGGQTCNVGTADLNHLSAYFLEKDGGVDVAVKQMIDRTVGERGWLILATHDVSDTPTPYGCRPGYFEDVVRYAAESGARVLPVIEALAVVRSGDVKAG